MSTTLPTVVGMGVVSHTTDTMFGGRRRKGGSAGRRGSKSRTPKVHTGPRGGRYIMKRGRRVYI